MEGKGDSTTGGEGQRQNRIDALVAENTALRNEISSWWMWWKVEQRLPKNVKYASIVGGGCNVACTQVHDRPCPRHLQKVRQSAEHMSRHIDYSKWDLLSVSSSSAADEGNGFSIALCGHGTEQSHDEHQAEEEEEEHDKIENAQDWMGNAAETENSDALLTEWQADGETNYTQTLRCWWWQNAGGRTPVSLGRPRCFLHN